MLYGFPSQKQLTNPVRLEVLDTYRKDPRVAAPEPFGDWRCMKFLREEAELDELLRVQQASCRVCRILLC